MTNHIIPNINGFPVRAREICEMVYPEYNMIPEFMRPDEEELKMVIKSIDPTAFNVVTKAIHNFNKEDNIISEVNVLENNLSDVNIKMKLEPTTQIMEIIDIIDTYEDRHQFVQVHKDDVIHFINVPASLKSLHKNTNVIIKVKEDNVIHQHIALTDVKNIMKNMPKQAEISFHRDNTSTIINNTDLFINIPTLSEDPLSNNLNINDDEAISIEYIPTNLKTDLPNLARKIQKLSKDMSKDKLNINKTYTKNSQKQNINKLKTYESSNMIVEIKDKGIIYDLNHVFDKKFIDYDIDMICNLYDSIYNNKAITDSTNIFKSIREGSGTSILETKIPQDVAKQVSNQHGTLLAMRRLISTLISNFYNDKSVETIINHICKDDINSYKDIIEDIYDIVDYNIISESPIKLESTIDKLWISMDKLGVTTRSNIFKYKHQISYIAKNPEDNLKIIHILYPRLVKHLIIVLCLKPCQRAPLCLYIQNKIESKLMLFKIKLSVMRYFNIDINNEKMYQSKFVDMFSLDMLAFNEKCSKPSHKMLSVKEIMDLGYNVLPTTEVQMYSNKNTVYIPEMSMKGWAEIKIMAKYGLDDKDKPYLNMWRQLFKDEQSKILYPIIFGRPRHEIDILLAISYNTSDFMPNSYSEICHNLTGLLESSKRSFRKSIRENPFAIVTAMISSIASIASLIILIINLKSSVGTGV